MMTLKYLYFADLSSPKMSNLNQLEKDFAMIVLIGTDLYKEDPTAKEITVNYVWKNLLGKGRFPWLQKMFVTCCRNYDL